MLLRRRVWRHGLTSQRSTIFQRLTGKDNTGLAAKQRLLPLVRDQRGEACIAPARLGGVAQSPERLAARPDHLFRVLGLVDRGRRRIGLEALVEAGVARAVVGDAARRVELDRLDRAHERPAQAEAVLDRLVEVSGTDDAVADQAE